jgi:hypothetical protein
MQTYQIRDDLIRLSSVRASLFSVPSSDCQRTQLPQHIQSQLDIAHLSINSGPSGSGVRAWREHISISYVNAGCLRHKTKFIIPRDGYFEDGTTKLGEDQSRVSWKGKTRGFL